MHEVRLVGRGGQGVVTAGELLGRAALLDGRRAQSIPTFGPERRGALSQATLRIDDSEILLKCSTAQPDVVLVLDPTVWQGSPALSGLAPGSRLVFNIQCSPEQLDADLRSGRKRAKPSRDDYELYCVDATGVALETIGRPITNTAMMGALVGATALVGMDSVERVLTDRFGARAEANIAAARLARERLVRLGE
jgi:2-oxoacid:acceptor oxidoreductase gamma subunit (pyruvate/2-ketoisovalerate family)